MLFTCVVIRGNNFNKIVQTDNQYLIITTLALRSSSVTDSGGLIRLGYQPPSDEGGFSPASESYAVATFSPSFTTTILTPPPPVTALGITQSYSKSAERPLFLSSSGFLVSMFEWVFQSTMLLFLTSPLSQTRSY
jgi:hypothetical protein